jgi:SAM-dependent methyltransferase
VRRFSEAEKQAILDMCEAGVPVKRIARHLGRQEDLHSIRAWLPDILTGRRVLDVASGTGYWTDVFAHGAASILATDVNDETLAVAQSRREWPPHVQFAVADAFDLDRVSGDFNAAFVGFFWSHIPLAKLDSFLSGLFGRLDDDAVVVFMDNLYVDGSNHPIVRTDDQGNTFQRRTLSGGGQWEVLKNFPSMDSLRSILERFSPHVDLRTWDYYWAATCSS